MGCTLYISIAISYLLKAMSKYVLEKHGLLLTSKRPYGNLIFLIKIKREFFQALAVSALLYGYTTWTLTKRLEKKLNRNYTRMLRAIFNNSWKQHPTN